MSVATPQSHPAPPARLTVASIADFDNRLLAMIYSHTEPIGHNPGNPVLVISLEGEIDHDAAPYLDRAVTKALDSGMAVCCDLSRTAFFGTAGAAVLFEAAQHAGDKKTTFGLRGVHGTAQRMLDAVGLDHRLINE